MPGPSSSDSDGTQTVRTRPVVLVLSHILTGHLAPNLRIAAGLVKRGWNVYFLGPTAEETRIVRSGATFLPLLGAADIHDGDLSWKDSSPYSGSAAGSSHAEQHLKTLLQSLLSFLPPADVRTVADTVTQCYDTIPAQWASVIAALRIISAAHISSSSSRGVLVLCDAFFHGLLPLYCGASLPADISKPIISLCISVTPPFLRFADLPPFGLALPFDPSPEGRAASVAAWKRWSKATAPIAQVLDDRIREAGGLQGLDPAKWPFASGANYVLHPCGVCQLGVRGFEYPRPDWPERFRFVGILPSDWTPGAAPSPQPAWWDELMQRRVKKVVIVTQGTFQVDLSSLLLPTLAALADTPDVLVVAILGRRGAQLPASHAASVPANARIADFLPYDAILPHADAWVHNGGFGAVTHGIAHGVPMVVAGEGQDKGENARRVAWAGIGVDMGTARPAEARLRAAIESVLQKPKYRQRVGELQRESSNIDSIATIETALLDASTQHL